MIDFDTFTRDPDHLKKILVTKDTTIYTKKDLYYLVPERFHAKNLLLLDTITKVITVGALVDVESKKYSILKSLLIVDIEPTSVGNITLQDGQKYKLLYFPKDSIFITNTLPVKRSDFIYDLAWDMFVIGNIPIYLEYEDISDIFKTLDQAGVRRSDLAYELMTTIIAKDPVNPKQPYRLYKGTKRPVYVGLINAKFYNSSLLAKLANGYLSKGITSGLSMSSKGDLTTIEKILRQ